MPEAMHNLVSEARKNRFSSIPTLSEDDIISVWENVSDFVLAQMCNQKGVNIPNLGTFTFTNKKMDIGNNKFILIQRPIFALSEKFSQTHALYCTKHHTTGEIPIVQLNFTALSVESPFDRDTVETCVREVLQAMSRVVSNQQNVEILFRGVGVLMIKDGRVKMKFFKDFLNSMDGSGNLVKVLENRPGTADSVMSTQTTLSAQRRPGTTTITLPKLNGSNNLLPPLQEHEHEDGDTERIPLPPTRPSTREVVHPHPVVGVNFTQEELRDALPSRGGSRGSIIGKMMSSPNLGSRTVRSAECGGKPEMAKSREEREEAIEVREEVSRVASAPLQAPEPPASSQLHKRSSRTDSRALRCTSPTHHHRTGQELCYLCMQRSMRNVPVSFENERRHKELEEDALLQQYQQMKDQEAILLDQANQNSMRQSNQKVSAFNLGVAECVRENKNKRPTDFVKSYIFQNRPLTPLRFYKQDEYSKALQSQVKLRMTRDKNERHDREFQERLEQVQLAEDLAAQREQYLRAKATQISQYQRALSAQIKRKPLPLPKAEQDSKEPIFGRFDATNEKLLDQKERSRNLLRCQLEMVSEKKKNSILEHLTKQKDESEMLERTKKELIEDRIGVHKRAHDMRKSLEDNWRAHYRNKLRREEDERSRMRTPGKLLLQQTEKYQRCGQCERRQTNCGESNIWSESRYIPGSRLMV